MAMPTTEPVRLPPEARLPKVAQGIGFLLAKNELLAAVGRRHGGAFTLNLPVLGPTVVISGPELVKDLFSTSTEFVVRPTHFGQAFGPGSTFSLAGKEQLARRRLLIPPLHGNRMGSYRDIIEGEVMREIANWPEGREFETLEPMLRITLGGILRAVFGAEGSALDELRSFLPDAVKLGSRLYMTPRIVRRDLGSWSPGGRFIDYRRRFDAAVDSLIAEARADDHLDRRRDVLSLLLQARYDDGEPIPDQHIADELLTLVAAGHETTATSLSWAVERLRRHPQLLQRLTQEVDEGGDELRQATIWEVQRTRPVIDGTTRLTKTRIRLGEWVIPEDFTVFVSARLAHASEESFAAAESFDPDRFIGAKPKPSEWIPFGGGVNRCIGAAFAHMETDVVLRTLLRELRFEPTDAPAERPHWRGVAFAPGRGGRAVVYRRASAASNGASHGSVVGHTS
jgi:cytochrome P450